MKKSESTASGPSLAFPVLFGMGVTLVLMAVGALIVLSGKADPDRIPVLALVCIAAGSLCTSFSSARQATKSRLVWGVAASVALFICLVVLSLVWVGQPVSLPRIGINLAVSLVAGGAGGALGAGIKRKKRRKK